MVIDLTDKVAIITGAGKGIGKETAKNLAEYKAKIVLVEIDEESANETADIIKAKGGDVLVVKADVQKARDVKRMVEEAIKHYGKIDILVNNVGPARTCSFTEITEEEWDRQITSVLKTTFLCCREVVPKMIKNGGGRIINVSSIAGRSTSIGCGAHYTVAKIGVLGLTRHLAKELGPKGITVNAIAPGTTATELIEKELSEEEKKKRAADVPLGRLARPEEQSAVILFLASNLASYINGAIIDVNGGSWLG